MVAATGTGSRYDDEAGREPCAAWRWRGLPSKTMCTTGDDVTGTNGMCRARERGNIDSGTARRCADRHLHQRHHHRHRYRGSRGVLSADSRRSLCPSRRPTDAHPARSRGGRVRRRRRRQGRGGRGQRARVCVYESSVHTPYTHSIHRASEPVRFYPLVRHDVARWSVRTLARSLARSFVRSGRSVARSLIRSHTQFIHTRALTHACVHTRTRTHAHTRARFKFVAREPTATRCRRVFDEFEGWRFFFWKKKKTLTFSFRTLATTVATRTPLTGPPPTSAPICQIALFACRRRSRTRSRVR